MEILSDLHVRNVPVTVIIPFYCGNETIQRAVLSVDLQTFRPSEIIIVDDGSPDPVRLESSESRVPVRIVRHETNLGIPSARNAGIREAKTDWVAFLDQDDEWTSDKLSRQWGLIGIDAKPQSAVWFGRCRFDATKGTDALIIPTVASGSKMCMGKGQAIRELILNGNVVPWITVLIHRQVFERIGYLDSRLVGGTDDYEFVLRAAAEGMRFVCCDTSRDQYCAVHHYTGRNHSNLSRFFAENCATIERLSESYATISAMKRMGISRWHFKMARYYDQLGQIDLARKYYRVALNLGTPLLRASLGLITLRLPRGIKSLGEAAWAHVKWLARL